MSWLETKYINLLSNRLNKFKRVGENYNFRCPICGDSQKNLNKTRGWILTAGGKERFYCHNCNASMRFAKFLFQIDPILHKEYSFEKLAENGGVRHVDNQAKQVKTPQVFTKPGILKTLVKVSQLDPSHPVKQYVQKREIPSRMHYKLYYSPKFKKWTNSVRPDKYTDFDKDEPRLIIPFFDRDKELIGYQGRSFKKDDPLKYITIILDESKPKIFGLDDLDTSDTIYMFEGPIDAMFIPNSLASAGGRIENEIKACTYIEKGNTVIVYDNEPRSKDTVKKINAAIENKYNVCIWPDGLEHKDINDMVMSGLSPETIKQIIDQNTYTDLQAKMRLATWRKDG